VLAEADTGPLIVFAEGAQKRLYVAFQPMRSDFPLQPAFPIFLANAVNSLVPREMVSAAMSIRAGQTFSVPASGESDTLEWTPEEGPSTTLRPTAGAFVVREAKRAGKYRLQVGKRKQAVYASMGSPNESNIAPQDRILLGRTSVAGNTATSRMGDYWRSMALIGLLVLAVEWWVFARRS
jgi:hypothetical protein